MSNANRTASPGRKTWVIIVNYNGQRFLPACLDALARQTTTDFTTLVVDNASTDDSLDQAVAAYPSLVVLREADNWGFAEGNNRGIRYALAHGAEIIVLLNYDTEVDPGFIAAGRTTLFHDPKTGLVQSKILLYDTETNTRTDRINTAGNKLHFLGFGYCGDFDVEDEGQFDADAEIQYGSGAALFIRRAVLEEIGLFVSWFFMYHEELDLCWRARLAGWHIRRSGHSVVWHKYAFGRNPRKFYYMERNRWAVLLKNYRWSTVLWLLPFGLLTEFGLLIDALRQGWFIHKVRAYGGWIAHLPAILADRKMVQASRRVSDREILAHMSADVIFAGY
ncbi:glycosyltransferase family 2 protein, partial [Candidatus Berkelbacteria bacterium]|nr:glycosyltransferase family 2 protein [Candidatus Berkelbacteria bacterium]